MTTCITTYGYTTCFDSKYSSVISYTYEFTLALQTSQHLRSSFNQATTALLCIACFNFVASGILIVRGIRRSVQESGRFRPVIYLKRPSGTIVIVPPMALLYAATFLCSIFYIAWTSDLIATYSLGVPSAAISITKMLVWLFVIAVFWCLCEFNLLITILAADLWSAGFYVRTALWTILPPIVLFIIGVPMAVISLVSEHKALNLVLASLKLVQTKTPEADTPGSTSARIANLYNDVTNAQRLMIGLQSVQIFFFSAVMLISVWNIVWVWRAVGQRCRALLSGSDVSGAAKGPSHRPTTVASAGAASEDASAGIASASDSRRTRKAPTTQGGFLRSTGIARSPLSPPSAPTVGQEQTDKANAGATSQEGAWSMHKAPQHKLRVLKSVRQSHTATALIVFLACLGCMVWSIIFLVRVANGRALEVMDEYYFAQDLIITGGQAVFVIWGLVSLLLPRHDDAVMGPVISAVAAHRPSPGFENASHRQQAGHHEVHHVGLAASPSFKEDDESQDSLPLKEDNEIQDLDLSLVPRLDTT